MLLTPVSTDEQFHPTTDELRIPGVTKIFHPFVDAIQINVCTLV